MIADPRRKSRRPIVDMYVFKFRPTLLDSIGDECMVQLLTVLVENIAVPFDRRDSRRRVDVSKDIIK
jgi:hypothetical protein